jgi:hypothetical protein
MSTDYAVSYGEFVIIRTLFTKMLGGIAQKPIFPAYDKAKMRVAGQKKDVSAGQVNFFCFFLDFCGI